MLITPLNRSPLSRRPTPLEANPGGQPSGLIFSQFGGDSGIVNLTQALAINGATLTPTLRLEGASAGASSWVPTVGATNLVTTSTGTAFATGELTPCTQAGETAVKFNGGTYFAVSGNSAYDVATATNDIIFEVVFQHAVTGVEQGVAGKYLAGRGPLIAVTAADAIAGYGALGFTPFSQLADQAWYHLIVFADRNGNNRAYLNGVVGATTANANVAETTATPFTVGAYAAGSSKSSGRVAMVQMWLATAGTINTTAEQDAIAADRFARLCGVKPIMSVGSAVVTSSRGTFAALDRVVNESTGERRIFHVGANWMRTCRRKSGSTWYNGYLPESVATNRLLQSENFASATWSKLNCSGAVGTAAPDGSTNGYAVTPAVGTSTHAVQQTVAGGTDTVSCWAKKGANDYFGIRLNSGGTDYAIFNLATGAVASTSGSNINAKIVDYGNGWYLCSCGPGGGTNQIYLVTTNSPTSLSYNEASGASVGTYIFGAMANNNTYLFFAQSYIRTTTTTQTRNTDSLSVAASGNYNNSLGAIQTKIIVPDMGATGDRPIIECYTGSTDKHTLAIDSTNVLKASVITGGVTQVSGTGSTNISDGTLHTAQCSYMTNNYKAGESTAEITDTSVTMPSVTTLNMGSFTSPVLNLHGLINQVKIFSKLKM